MMSKSNKALFIVSFVLGCIIVLLTIVNFVIIAMRRQSKSDNSVVDVQPHLMDRNDVNNDMFEEVVQTDDSN
ncbi:MAG: hypothetical protein P0Y55_01965 [Candidatus Cohnella colombiensis]|uniref:Uncharacterized protein n=1 Tax=Candidatus Cohnella colombiensis TaxID=3121368 RepID=A0AA95EXG6_9BACL|nr:MAG: hypothetical protein P0Y55_01965 [Cohnella sp.]